MQKKLILHTRALQIPWSNSIAFRFHQAEFRASRSSAKKHSQLSYRLAQMLFPERGRIGSCPDLSKKTQSLCIYKDALAFT